MRLESAISQLKRNNIEHPKIFVVGGGAGGVEVSLCLKNFLVKRGINQFEIHLATASQQLAPGTLSSTEKRIVLALEHNQIQIHKGKRVEITGDSELTFKSETAQGEVLEHVTDEFDLVLWATTAVPKDLLASVPLPKDPKGFLLTRPTLQSTGSEDIFVVGDSGTMEDSPTPKAGVYAVRQGPVLWQNLKKKLSNQKLVKYKPQRNFLKLLNSGDGKSDRRIKRYQYS